MSNTNRSKRRPITPQHIAVGEKTEDQPKRTLQHG